MKWVSVFVLLLPMALTTLVGCSDARFDAPMHEEAIGEAGILRFDLDADKPLALGKNDFLLTIHDIGSDEPLTGARIELSAIMVSMGHEAPAAQPIAETSPGIYALRDLSLNMAGRWELRIRASQTNPVDDVSFTFDIH